MLMDYNIEPIILIFFNLKEIKLLLSKSFNNLLFMFLKEIETVYKVY